MLSVCHVNILKSYNLLSVCTVDMFNAMLSFVLNLSSCLSTVGMLKCHVIIPTPHVVLTQSTLIFIMCNQCVALLKLQVVLF